MSGLAAASLQAQSTGGHGVKVGAHADFRVVTGEMPSSPRCPTMWYTTMLLGMVGRVPAPSPLRTSPCPVSGLVPGLHRYLLLLASDEMKAL